MRLEEVEDELLRRLERKVKAKGRSRGPYRKAVLSLPS